MEPLRLGGGVVAAAARRVVASQAHGQARWLAFTIAGGSYNSMLSEWADMSWRAGYDELLVACLERGVAEEEIATLFETIDLNGDGVISKDEWRQGFAKFTAAAEAESEAAEEAAEAEAERKAARDASARSPGAALAEAWSEAPASAPVAEFVREASDEEVPVAVPSALPSAPPAPTASVPVR